MPAVPGGQEALRMLQAEEHLLRGDTVPQIKPIRSPAGPPCLVEFYNLGVLLLVFTDTA